MYSIHTTRGFILGSRPYSEAGKLLSIFTEEFGLIRATAQSVRVEKSKLRPFIQDHSFGLYSFVRGKEYWRLTNAQEIQPQATSGKSQVTSRKNISAWMELTARVAGLLNRLLQGEEANAKLFETISAFSRFMSLDHAEIDFERSDLSMALESLIVIRILHRLGYVPMIAGLELEIASDAFDTHLLERLISKRPEMNIHINRALRESHL